MVPIYSRDVLGLLTDGSPAHLHGLTPKPGLRSLFQLRYLKNAGVFKRKTSENHTRGQQLKRHFTQTHQKATY